MEKETKHLVIKDTVFSDLETFYMMELEPAVTKFFSIEDGQSRETVYEKYFADAADPGARQFSVFLKKTNGEVGDPDKPIGRIVLADIIDGWKCEIWRIYIADPALRGKGYGKEAMEEILRYCFEELQMQRVYLDFYTGNPAEFLYKSLGFKEEGVLRHNCRKNGVLHDVHLMSMLREEYYGRP